MPLSIRHRRKIFLAHQLPLGVEPSRTERPRIVRTNRKNPTQSTDLLPQAKSRLLGKLKRAGTERAKQARLIRQIADGITGAVVICGDFNDTPQSYAYRKIRDDFSDAYVSTGFGPGITYNEQGFWFRIDHILYNNVLRAVDSRIVRQKHSDHYPLRATLQWNTKND